MGQTCLCYHLSSIPSRFMHRPVISSETLNSKLLRESPRGLALIPYLPLDTTGHAQSQKNPIYKVRIFQHSGKDKFLKKEKEGWEKIMG